LLLKSNFHSFSDTQKQVYDVKQHFSNPIDIVGLSWYRKILNIVIVMYVFGNVVFSNVVFGFSSFLKLIKK